MESMKSFRLDIEVRSTEIDINGHVNNAKYLEYLEWGRGVWYEQSGLAIETLLSLGMQAVAVNININYRKECRQGDKLTIITEAVRAGRTSYVLNQEIVNQAGERCADAVITSVAMDVHTRASRPIPDLLRAQFPVLS